MILVKRMFEECGQASVLSFILYLLVFQVVSHRLTPSCVFSENPVEIFKILQEFQRKITEFPSLSASVAGNQPSLSDTRPKPMLPNL